MNYGLFSFYYCAYLLNYVSIYTSNLAWLLEGHNGT